MGRSRIEYTMEWDKIEHRMEYRLEWNVEYIIE